MSAFVDFFKNLFVGSPEIVQPEPQNQERVIASVIAGRSTGAGSDGSKWDFGLSASGNAPTINHSTSRRNARSAYLNSLQAHAIVQRYADSVVDTGLKLKSAPVSSVIGISDIEAEQWSSEVERRFHLWASDKNANRQGLMDFYQFQRLICICQHRDGEYFVRLYYNSRRDLQNSVQFRAIDPSLIRSAGLTPTTGPGYLQDGIRRDSSGREISYAMIVDDNGQYREVEIPAFGGRSGRPLMLHGFQPEWPEQVRGYPRYFHALQEFENITDFSLAHIKKAINQSMITMYVKPNSTNPSSNPFASISLDSPVSAVDSSLLESNPGAVDSMDPQLDYVPLPEASFNAPGSVGVFNLREGEDLKAFQDTAPVADFGRFVNEFVTHLAASVSMPAEVLLMKFTQNYSASRGALILFWRIAEMWRAEMASDLLNPIFEAWISGEIAAGRITAPGWSDPRIKRAWLNCHWSGVPMPNIDPQKTAKADQLYTEMGAQTLQDVAQNLNGSDFDSNKSRLTRELDGLPRPPWGSSAAPSEISEEEED